MEVKVDVIECVFDVVYVYYYIFDTWEEHFEVITTIKEIHPEEKEFEINFNNNKYYYKVRKVEKTKFSRKEKESDRVLKKKDNKKTKKEVNISVEEIYEKYEDYKVKN